LYSSDKRSEASGDGPEKSGIGTPNKIRKLQIALYRKAKAEPKWRFYSLYGEICREDVLLEAVRKVKANKGPAGVDGVIPADIERAAGGVLQWVRTLGEELRAKEYEASPVKRVWIANAGGKKRPLGIPTVKDRVVQTALWLVWMPI
jgi:retron-type reverse transcriptase